MNSIKTLFLAIALLLIFASCNKNDENVEIPDVKSFLENNTFKLEYFLITNKRQNLILTNNRDNPTINFKYNNEQNLLVANIKGYCNGTSAKYKINDSFLSAIERGATTLSDCGGDEETNYFTPITGDIYLQQPAKKIFFEINHNTSHIYFWINKSHKLYFSRQ